MCDVKHTRYVGFVLTSTADCQALFPPRAKDVLGRGRRVLPGEPGISPRGNDVVQLDTDEHRSIGVSLGLASSTSTHGPQISQKGRHGFHRFSQKIHANL